MFYKNFDNICRFYNYLIVFIDNLVYQLGMIFLTIKKSL